MRLIHTTKLTFQEFFDNKIPPYCILSHRWGDDEVSYNDFVAGRNKDGKGYAKILAACDYAFRVGGGYLNENPPQNIYNWKSNSLDNSYEWIWIDTCCIDKASSAELSEAINSMYEWYQKARVCLVYLYDVTSGDDQAKLLDSFRQSDWHTRGWTLQELLAPRYVHFLDQTWRCFGTKQSLASTISEVTKISARHFSQYYAEFNPACVSIAEKMSWAALRRTSRLEDRAYCLLGLFNINMPLLYGEGEKAFRRLQLELLKSSDDESIFLWPMWGPDSFLGILPSWPQDYQVLPPDIDNEFLMQVDTKSARHSYTVTNKGIEIHVPAHLARQEYFLLPLECMHPSGKVYAIGLYLADDLWYRVKNVHHWGPGDGSSDTGYGSSDTGYGSSDTGYGSSDTGYGSSDTSDASSIIFNSGIYLVDSEELWNRETLRQSGSEVIVVSLDDMLRSELRSFTIVSLTRTRRIAGLNPLLNHLPHDENGLNVPSAFAGEGGATPGGSGFERGVKGDRATNCIGYSLGGCWNLHVPKVTKHVVDVTN